MKKINYQKCLVLFVALLGSLIVTQAQNTYVLGEGSRAWVEGTSTLKNWNAEVNKFDGTITTDEQGTITKVMFSFDVKSMDGGRGPDMNGKIYKALKADEYPAITFEGTGAVADDDSQGVVGTLSLAGKKQETSVSGTVDLDAMHISAQKNLKLSDFEIEPPSAMFGTIVCHDDLVLMFDLNLTKQSQ
jgi:polyisoprenoid-binding protein YceI